MRKSLSFLVFLGLASCGLGGDIAGDATLISNSERVDAFLNLRSGDQQFGLLGELLGAPLVVEAVMRSGEKLAGKKVQFSVVEGNATLIDADDLHTNEEGIASVQVRMGNAISDVSVEASLKVNGGAEDQHKVTFSLRSVDTLGPKLYAAGDGSDTQTGTVGENLSVQVIARDTSGVPKSGEEIAFEVIESAATVTIDPSAETNEDGIATALMALPILEQTMKIKATWLPNDGDDPNREVIFTVIAERGAPAIIKFDRGHMSSGERACVTEDQPYPTIWLKVTDLYGNVHPEIDVRVDPDSRSSVNGNAEGEPVEDLRTNKNGEVPIAVTAGTVGSSSSCETGSTRDVGYCNQTTIVAEVMGVSPAVETSTKLNFTKAVHFVRYQTPEFQYGDAQYHIHAEGSLAEFDIHALAYRDCWSEIPESQMSFTWSKLTEGGMCSVADPGHLILWFPYTSAYPQGYSMNVSDGYVDIDVTARVSTYDINAGYGAPEGNRIWLEIPEGDHLTFYMDDDYYCPWP